MRAVLEQQRSQSTTTNVQRCVLIRSSELGCALSHWRMLIYRIARSYRLHESSEIKCLGKESTNDCQMYATSDFENISIQIICSSC